MRTLIAIDNSPFSQTVVDAVSRRRWPERTEFRIITVIEPLAVNDDPSAISEYSHTVSQIRRYRERTARQKCEEARKKLQAAIPGALIDVDIQEGSPRALIINAASEWAADEIIIGAHSRELCPRDLIGSVSRAVAAHAPCSVEIVRPAQHEMQPLTKRSSKKTTQKQIS
ncbi:MAG TPA: universal stress protein [Oculatellaceae cyanobacterium]